MGTVATHDCGLADGRNHQGGADMVFTESNTVEQMILDTVTGKSAAPWVWRDRGSAYSGSLGPELRPTHWEYVPGPLLPRGM